MPAADDLRKKAEEFFRNGYCEIAAAFDLADCREWRFDRDTQECARGHLQELMSLFDERAIQQNCRVAGANAAAHAAAKDDEFTAGDRVLVDGRRATVMAPRGFGYTLKLDLPIDACDLRYALPQELERVPRRDDPAFQLFMRTVMEKPAKRRARKPRPAA